MRASRISRTISMLQMTIKNPSRSRHDSRRGSGSSNSSSTLNGLGALRSRSPAPSSHSPEDKPALPTVGFQLPAIETGDAIALDAPPTPSPQPLALGSCASLNTLRDRPVIRFAPAAGADVADPDGARGGMPRLLIRELIPTSAISQVTQLSEVDGSFRVTVQATMPDGSPVELVFKQLCKEAAGLWLRMFKRAVAMVAVEESVARGNDNYHLLVNPRLNPVNPTHMPLVAAL
ncbi:hypothetical protein IWQ57_006568 [Coemansia nantahalensis]|uniref:Uncharacterized protein n=1 Tax=Coemansia nantahalensis TaxID=2789366 RepID=A0ACC1JJD2_9FUNG|nr:hypothetical protein IWQ57_006568 [Coemansia nantahalensis]